MVGGSSPPVGDSFLIIKQTHFLNLYYIPTFRVVFEYKIEWSSFFIVHCIDCKTCPSIVDVEFLVLKICDSRSVEKRTW